jgi:hypothetical protein
MTVGLINKVSASLRRVPMTEEAVSSDRFSLRSKYASVHGGRGSTASTALWQAWSEPSLDDFAPTC